MNLSLTPDNGEKVKIHRNIKFSAYCVQLSSPYKKRRLCEGVSLIKRYSLKTGENSEMRR